MYYIKHPPYLHVHDEGVVDFLQNILLVFDMFDLLQSDNIGHRENFHRPVLVGDFVPAETHPAKGASSCNAETKKNNKPIRISAIINLKAILPNEK